MYLFDDDCLQRDERMMENRKEMSERRGNHFECESNSNIQKHANELFTVIRLS